MDDRMFDSLVVVKNGNSLIQEIGCIEALEFLTRWPQIRRGTIYETPRCAPASAISTATIRCRPPGKPTRFCQFGRHAC